jgi:hypothetical protein
MPITAEQRATDRRSGKGCWYYTETHACPVCGSEHVYRERRQPPRPENDSERYDYSEDSPCTDHFL